MSHGNAGVWWSRHQERIYILAKLSRDRRKLLWMSAYTSILILIFQRIIAIAGICICLVSAHLLSIKIWVFYICPASPISLALINIRGLPIQATRLPCQRQRGFSYIQRIINLQKLLEELEYYKTTAGGLYTYILVFKNAESYSPARLPSTNIIPSRPLQDLGTRLSYHKRNIAYSLNRYASQSYSRISSSVSLSKYIITTSLKNNTQTP